MGDGKPTAVLTKSQREYLRGDREPTQERTMKTRIRERVRHALLDFSLLFEHWPEEERETIFFNLRDEKMDVAIVDLLALIYGETKVGYSFENLLHRGVTKAERRAAGTDALQVKTNFEVEEVERVNVEDAVEKYQRGDLRDMTDAEKSALLRIIYKGDAVSPEEMEASKEAWEQELLRQIDEEETRADHWREKQRQHGESQSSEE